MQRTLKWALRILFEFGGLDTSFSMSLPSLMAALGMASGIGTNNGLGFGIFFVALCCGIFGLSTMIQLNPMA